MLQSNENNTRGKTNTQSRFDELKENDCAEERKVRSTTIKPSQANATINAKKIMQQQCQEQNSYNNEEQHNINEATEEVLDQLIVETHEARLATENACTDKNYELWSALVHIQELEQEIEETLVNKEESSGITDKENMDNYFEEEEDGDEDSDKAEEDVGLDNYLTSEEEE